MDHKHKCCEKWLRILKLCSGRLFYDQLDLFVKLGFL
jgi:hypothetical protein